MFKLVPDAINPWPVKWNHVIDGEVVEVSMTLDFVRIGATEFHQLFAPLADDATQADIAAHNRATFDRVVRGWRDIVDAGGDPLPFTADNVALLLDYPGFAYAFGAAYAGFWYAIPEERRKNSVPSPAGGPATATTAATTAAAPTIATA